MSPTPQMVTAHKPRTTTPILTRWSLFMNLVLQTIMMKVFITTSKSRQLIERSRLRQYCIFIKSCMYSNKALVQWLYSEWPSFSSYWLLSSDIIHFTSMSRFFLGAQQLSFTGMFFEFHENFWVHNRGRYMDGFQLLCNILITRAIEFGVILSRRYMITYTLYSRVFAPRTA